MRTVYIITASLSLLLLSSFTVFAQTPSREDLLKQLQAKRAAIEAQRTEMATLEKALLLPAAEDQKHYADFLRQPDTGLIRLLPREKYEESNVDQPIAIVLRGGGAFYSFARRNQEYGNGSDIALEQGHLFTGFAGADYGLLSNLGDVSLEQLNLTSPRVKVLAAYNPPTDMPLARAEYQKTQQGTDINGTVFKRQLPLLANSTYLLRSVNYSKSDVLVAFRVVRIDSDGSAIILWKLLKQYPTPQIVRASNRK